ncbi:unnamed protein product [Zymoseptoria tritici ST99CH_3D1]|nr:unnamed protein product [Zymoseptoria tritici ST99CH_3D1]
MTTSPDEKHESVQSTITMLHSSDSTKKHSSYISTVSMDGASVERTGEHILEYSDADWKPSKQIKLILVGQICVVFAISLDMTILTTTLPAVAVALNTNATGAFWIASSYLLANAVVQPIMAGLADIFGRRSITFSALCIFTLGSIICCVANDLVTMLVGRTIQRIGGGGVLSVNLIILSDLIPLRVRPKYLSIMQLTVSIGFNIAPIIGGAFVKVTTWRWLFYINLPFCAVGLAIIPFVLRYKRPESTFEEKLSKIDWIGSFAFIFGMTTFLVGLSWGGSQYPWSSAATLVPLILGLATVFCTGLYERFLAKQTFLRLALFNTWSAISIYFLTILQALVLFTEVYFLCLYLMGVKGFSPFRTGVSFLAFAFIMIPTNGIVGAVIARVGSYRWAIWSGWAISTMSLGLFTLLDVNTPVHAWVPLFLTAGLGQGILFLAHSIASQAACEQKDAAHANCMYSFMRSLGLCFGVSLGGAIFQNLLRMRLIEKRLPAEIAKSAEAFAHLLSNMKPSAEKTEIVAAYAWTFRMLFAVMCGISALGLVISVLLITAKSLDQEIDSEHRLRRRSTIEQAADVVRAMSMAREKETARREKKMAKKEKEKDKVPSGIINLGSWFPELPPV